MPVYMSASTDVTYSSNYSLAAGLIAGGNGDPWGQPDVSIGDSSSSDQTYDSYTWDGNTDDGFDSGEVAICFNANATSGSTLALTGDSSDTIESPMGFGSASRVTLRFGVENPDMEIDWSGISVEFYKGGALQDAMSIPDGKVRGTDDKPQQEQDYVCVPDASSFDQVIVAGNVHLVGNDETVTPANADIFCQVIIS